MECEDLSDLEEGEIFEYEYCSPGESRQNVMETDQPNILKKKNISQWFEFKDKDDSLCFSNQGKNGYVNIDLKEKLKLNYRETNHNLKKKNNVECVSSDGEYKSEENESYAVEENKDLILYNQNERLKKKHYCHMSYGTVEDIMSEIGETISRKNRCGYYRRKSREMKYNLGKFYAREDSPQEVLSRKMFSSHFSNSKSRKRRKKVSCSESESEMFTKEISKSRRCRRKKKKEVQHRSGDEEEVLTNKKVSNNQMRDFDEVRKSLLEKLKKQKVEGSLKETGEPAAAPGEQELENSEIQEVEMLIDCTNYVDNPPGGNENGLASELTANENAGEIGEDELDVIKLRLIALASNRRRKCGETLSASERLEDCSEKSAQSKDVEDGDLDRSELLLRAEALKTALLKKHQKRLNKLKKDQSNGIASSSDNDLSPFSPQATLAKTEEKGKSEAIGFLSCDSKPAVNEGVTGTGCSETDAHCSTIQRGADSQTNTMETNQMSSIGEKKINGKVRGKRKKKRSVSQPSKENTEKSEGMEEDDRALRSQLLTDLMRKKSLKDLERKSVLMDSVQASVNKKLPPVADVKPVSVKRAVLKKVNLTRGTLPVPVPKIPKPEIQRIIVHLGSEDSSDEDEKVSISAQDGKRLVPTKEKENGGESTMAPRQTDEITQANYEKSVELLLSQARKKIEGEMQTAKNNPLDTPEAVYKHLPPSQRLEYIRLKQKIAERERLKKLRSEIPTGSASTVSAAPPTAQPTGLKESKENGPVARIVTTPASPAGKSRTVLCKNAVLNLKSRSLNGLVASVKPQHVGKSKNISVVPPSKAIISKAPGNGKVLRNTLLLPSSQALISKLKLLLKKIKIEKCMEENYEKEISKLKIQLSLFEKKKNEQRFKIKKLAEESMKIYGVIQGITNPGQKIGGAKAEVKQGEKTQKQEEKTQKQEERKAEVEGKVAAESEDKISEAKSQSEPEKEVVRCTVSEGGHAAGELLEYTSPLDALNSASGCSERVDPNVIVCQFDLMGVCKDEECRYQHFRSS